MKTNTAVAAVAAALALHWFLLYPCLARPDHDFDAVHMYLPLAQRLLAEGFAFFGTEASIQMPPFSYAWPALFGAKLATVKMANFLLSGATLVLVFRTAWLLHSRAAGVAAAFLFAACPLFKPTLATAITEPPYLMLLAVWIWALAEWFASPRRVFIPIAGIAFGLAILTRGTFFYWLLALIAFFAWRREKGALAAHLIALALPLAFIAKNALLFSFPFFATGAGNALYLGTNPVTGGYDPYYVGLIFDVGAIAPGPAPLTLEAERLLGGVARMLLAETDKGQLAALWAKKLAAFLFVSNAAEGNVAWLRAWRIVMMVLAAAGVMGIASRTLRWVVAGSVLYQVAIHVPVLYTLRYSVGAVDLWLVLLAGIGLATLYERRNARAIAAVAAVAIAGVAGGAYAYRYAGSPEPDVFRAKHQVIWETRGVKLHAGTNEIAVRDAPLFHPWFNYVLVVDSAGACDALRISYQRDADKDLGPEVKRREADRDFGPVVERRMEGDGQVHRHQLGAIVPLGINAEGRLKIETPCELDVPYLGVYSAIGALDYRERFLAKPR